MWYPEIIHHGATRGVTGSCHEVCVVVNNRMLVDCGLFQGDEAPCERNFSDHLKMDFPIENIPALVVSHVPGSCRSNSLSARGRF